MKVNSQMTIMSLSIINFFQMKNLFDLTIFLLIFQFIKKFHFHKRFIMVIMLIVIKYYFIIINFILV